MTAKIVNVLVGKSKSRKSRQRANDTTIDASSEEFAHRAFHIDCHKL